MLLGGGSENIASVNPRLLEAATMQGLRDGFVVEEPVYTAEVESSFGTYVELSIQNEIAGAYDLDRIAIGIARGQVERTRPAEIFNSVIDPGFFQLRKRAPVEGVRVRTAVGANGGSQFLTKYGRENGACGLFDIHFVLIRCSFHAIRSSFCAIRRRACPFRPSGISCDRAGNALSLAPCNLPTYKTESFSL